MSNISNDSALNADGRFGRLSYLGWNGLLLFVVMTLGILSAVLLPGFVPEPSQDMPLSPMLLLGICLLYTSPSPRDRTRSRMPSSA